MLQSFLQPQLETGGIKSTTVFQKNGALPHFARIVRDYPDEQVIDRWIGNGSRRL